MRFAFCIAVLLASIVSSFLTPWIAQAATFDDGVGMPLTAGTCVMVNTRAEAKRGNAVYTLNPDHTIKLNQAYLSFWGRNARCDELQFHVDRNMKIAKLSSWLNKRAVAWYRDLKNSPYEGRTVSTSRREWFLVQNGQLRHIPDWLTAMSWGLRIPARASIPSRMTDIFYESATVGEPLQYSAGPYWSAIEERRRNGTALPATVPQPVRDEVQAFAQNAVFGNIFFLQRYVPRSADDAYAKLLDWSWVAENPEADFTIAFIGDQGNTGNSRAVLELIRSEGADMVIHSGDFDYLDSPKKWDDLITSVLGASFPYFASIGNHDVAEWSGYQQKLQARLNRLEGEQCSGDLGVQSFCVYRGIGFVLSGAGTLGSGHETYLSEALSSATQTWKICSWHKNQRLMQVEGKGDEVGWEPYELCRQHGAIITTGHAHVYSRTHLMSSFSDTPAVASTSSTLLLKPGQTFTVVSGLAGHSIREQNDTLAVNPWWASVYTKTQNATYGALLCTFNKDGDPKRAECAFKTIAGQTVDSFTLTRE